MSERSGCCVSSEICHWRSVISGVYHSGDLSVRRQSILEICHLGDLSFWEFVILASRACPRLRFFDFTTFLRVCGAPDIVFLFSPHSRLPVMSQAHFLRVSHRQWPTSHSRPHCVSAFMRRTRTCPCSRVGDVTEGLGDVTECFGFSGNEGSFSRVSVSLCVTCRCRTCVVCVCVFLCNLLLG